MGKTGPKTVGEPEDTLQDPGQNAGGANFAGKILDGLQTKPTHASGARGSNAIDVFAAA